MPDTHHETGDRAVHRANRVAAAKRALGTAAAELYAAGATPVRETIQTALRRAPYVFRARYLQAKAHLQMVGRTG